MAKRETVSSRINMNRVATTSKGLHQFPEDLGAHGMLFVFKQYRFQNPGTRTFTNMEQSVSNMKDSILLPLPTNIADSYSIRIGRPEMGVVSEAVATAAAGAISGSGVTSGVNNELKKMAISNSDAEAIIRGGDASTIGQNLKFLLRSATPNGLSTAIDQGLGATVNPKMSLSFDGLDMKTHAFDWNLMVRSPNESNSLAAIQNTIKRNIHPRYASAGTFQRAMLRYPSVVDIFFVGLDQDYFFKFKTCMVQSFSLNYTPNGLSIIEGGKPAGAQMSLQLVETDIHSAEDYGADSGGDVSSVDVDNIFNGSERGDQWTGPR